MRSLSNTDPVLHHFWWPAALADEVTELPIRVRIAGVPVALARGSSGVIAVHDRCSHRGVPLHLGKVDGEYLVCPYHGFAFDATGRCRRIPALGDGTEVPSRADVVGYRVAEKYGIVWVALDEPWAPLIEIPEWDSPGWTCLVERREPWAANAAAMLENLLDMAHLPWVHAGSLGDPGDVEGRIVARRADGFSIVYEQVAADESGHAKARTVRYDVHAPLVMRGEFAYPGVAHVAFGVLCPNDARTTTTFGISMHRGDHDWEAFRAFQSKVVEEDRWVIEAIAGEPFHLDRRADMHTIADKAGLELRRMWSAYVDRLPGQATPADPTPPDTRQGGPTWP